MERLILSPRTDIFSGKRDFLKSRPKFPNGMENVRSIFMGSRPFWLGSPLIL